MKAYFRSHTFIVLSLLFFVSSCPLLTAGTGEDYFIRAGKADKSEFELQCSDENIVKAYEMAIETIEGNIKSWQKGLLESKKPVLIAGKGYSRPWTRDASYNSYFALGFAWSEVSGNTLISVLEKVDGKIRIGGQYWDSIGWSIGAWEYYCCTGDREFLKTAYQAVTNTLEHFRKTEFDSSTGLYCGPGWSDGIAGYPQPYNLIPDNSSFILDYANKNENVDKIRMKTLSTNCLYYQGHILAAKMAKELAIDADKQKELSKRAKSLKRAINKNLWLKKAGRYGYFLDRDGKLETSMEALGHAFAVLFGVASEKQTKEIFMNQYVSKYGVVCNWPKFERFADNEMPRHCAAIWPQIQGFWALAGASNRKADILYHELNNLGKMAIASNDFREIYDPQTGRPNGGVQSGKQWHSEDGQSWAATAYLAMIHKGVFGMRFEADGIRFDPIVKKHFQGAQLKSMRYRDMLLDIKLIGSGDKVTKFLINGTNTNRHFVDADLKGYVKVEIYVERSGFLKGKKN